MSSRSRTTWAVRRVKSIATKIGSGKTPTGGSALYQDTGVLFLRSQNVHFDGLRLDDVAYIDHATHHAMRSSQVRGGDVLLNITGASLGRVSRVGPGFGQANVNQHVCIVRPGSHVDSRFLAYALSASNVQEQILALQVGGNRDGLNFEQVGNLEMCLPELDEQQRVADFLDAETRRIDEVRLARSRMQDLLRLKRERVIDHLLDDQGDARKSIPLKHLVESVTVGIVVTPAAWYVDGGGVPALRGVNVKPGKIDDKDLVQISHEGHRVHRKSRLKVGDLVVVRTGQAGAAAVVTEEFNGINCIDLVIVRPGDALAPRFVEYLLNSSYARRRVAEFAVGSIQSHFNVAAMKAMPVPRRSLADQHRTVLDIDRAIEPIERTVSEMQKQDELLAERRQALITAAVNGQIDVTTTSGQRNGLDL